MRNARSFSILALAGLIALTNTAAAAPATAGTSFRPTATTGCSKATWAACPR